MFDVAEYEEELNSRTRRNLEVAESLIESAKYLGGQVKSEVYNWFGDDFMEEIIKIPHKEGEASLRVVKRMKVTEVSIDLSEIKTDYQRLMLTRLLLLMVAKHPHQRTLTPYTIGNNF